MTHPTPVKPAPARPAPQTRSVALPPETLEGWYATHQLYSIDRARLREMERGRRAELRARAAATLDLLGRPAEGGWTGCVTLVGSRADAMLVHFRPTLDAVGEAERAFAREPLFDVLKPAYSFLSVTEAGLYQITADAAADAEKRGGKVGDEEYTARIARKAQRELESAHVQKRLFPTPPEGMPYVCFYPMSKRRVPGQNWYSLPIAERSRLMYEHGMTGRRYAGKV
ncbi:MAG TPA: chlorite dismutase family protein, partial [Gemmatimonadaceae bacterium]|nr:chlorite dismutase family protein [Gemmatimonadaceae bacterium]